MNDIIEHQTTPPAKVLANWAMKHADALLAALEKGE